MFIRKVLHKNKKNRKEYFTYKLVESVRTERGPRQRDVLNLGASFNLAMEQWKDLANCIETELTGQRPLFDYPKKLRALARKYARAIIHQRSEAIDERHDIPADYQVVDVNSVDSEDIRTVGAEHVVYETIKELGLDRKLRSFGLTRMQLSLALGMIAGRIIFPGSERATHQWLLERSALDELMGVDFSGVSLDGAYKAGDLLLKNKEAIEEHLRQTEGQLFGLDEKIILYDLTNTFIEGTGKFNGKARYGRSKEKRSDCLLMTLGLVLDVQGFPKKSRIYEGNISEPKTLEQMIKGLFIGECGQDPLLMPMIVLDAGIASEDNIKWLRSKSYRYIVVSRKKKKAIPPSVTMVAVKRNDDDDVLVEAGLCNNPDTDELDLYCHSLDKEKKEEGIKNRFQSRLESDLTTARSALNKKNGTKNYEKVIERIGRLKERYRSVAHGYKITVVRHPGTDKAKDIKWTHTKREKTSGVYCLRTNQKDLEVQQIWDIYTMLTDIEDAFRCMKSELGLRPIYHQKEARCDGHIFITVIAYHLMHTIRFKLRHKGVKFCWTTIRRQLSTHVRATTTMKRKDNKVIKIRKSSKTEPAHEVIYDALGLSHRPGRTVKTIL
ncbi:MAG: IS1634 family transposase [Candidatus Promineifilaceae bacterium]|jgi:transposase